jgi:hypothetical protein
MSRFLEPLHQRKNIRILTKKQEDEDEGEEQEIRRKGKKINKMKQENKITSETYTASIVQTEVLTK